MSGNNINQTSLCQVYQGLMASMTAKDCNVFMCMPRSSRVCFLNQLLSANSHQLQAQDCDTMVLGSEHSIITHVEGEEDAKSIFAETEVLLV
ncbi:hypothetical protein DSO57_1024255 [Entomophthora muscae]|uniref:Uncharacterized protein n=1 Tax=Entomophthora muscae TaxID=34485 RepID=A0ACC2RHK0_9FUNG|nr:hypothetical protein DSO57_1024255 [Entomophthora muscae]